MISTVAGLLGAARPDQRENNKKPCRKPRFRRIFLLTDGGLWCIITDALCDKHIASDASGRAVHSARPRGIIFNRRSQHMKVRPSVKPICEKCKIIRREQGHGHLRKSEAQAEAGLRKHHRGQCAHGVFLYVHNACYYQQNLRLQSLVTEHAFVLKCVDYHTRRHNNDEKRCYRN